MRVIQGEVHDENASVMGGISATPDFSPMRSMSPCSPTRCSAVAADPVA